MDIKNERDDLVKRDNSNMDETDRKRKSLCEIEESKGGRQ